MKTTLEISDAILGQAKTVARQERITLRALVEKGLRLVLQNYKKDTRPFRLRVVTFKGKGLSPEFSDGSWERIRDAAYEGRGG